MEKPRYTVVIGSLFFAALVWISVNMKDDYTVIRRLPVVVENLKAGKALRYPIPRFVSVRFRGNGWMLAGIYLSPDIRYYIDVSGVGTDDFMITGAELNEHVKLTFPVQALDVKPDTMILALDDYREKKVPVVIRSVLGFREGYGQVGPVQVAPESITVGGAQNTISRITEWPTAYQKLDNLRSPVDMQLPLEESPSLAVDISEGSVRYRVNVQPFAEKTFAGIVLAAAGVPANREVIFVPPRVDLIARGGIDQLARISMDDFQASIGFQELLQDSSGTIVPSISCPEGITIVSRTPSQFQFVIRKKL